MAGRYPAPSGRHPARANVTLPTSRRRPHAADLASPTSPRRSRLVDLIWSTQPWRPRGTGSTRLGDDATDRGDVTMTDGVLRVAQLNAGSLLEPGWEQRRHEIVAWLDRLDPDVVCLQEIWA